MQNPNGPLAAISTSTVLSTFRLFSQTGTKSFHFISRYTKIETKIAYKQAIAALSVGVKHPVTTPKTTIRTVPNPQMDSFRLFSRYFQEKGEVF